MKGKQLKYHPLLRELKLAKNQAAKAEQDISSLDVLNYLLENSGVTQESVRAAFQSLLEAKSNNATNIVQGEEQLPKIDNEKKDLPQNKNRTRHIALRFFYDGGNFNGLAQNLGQESDNSVEKNLFQALLKAKLVESRETSGYSRCGRTDKGVSAAGQVVALHLKSTIPLDASFDSEGTSLVVDDDLPKNEYEQVKVWVHPRKKKDPSSSRLEKEMSEYPYARIL